MKSAIAFVGIAIAITGVINIYGLSQFVITNDPPEVAAVPTVYQITALGRLKPVSEVIQISALASLSNDRVAELLVQRGDWVEANQVIAILASRDRLQTAWLEAKEHVRVAQAELAQVYAGAKSGEIAAQRAEITRLQQDLQGEISIQQATISRWQAEVNTARADYERYLSLYIEGAIAAEERDQKRLQLETTQAQLNESQANQTRTLDTLREQMQQAEATLDQIAEVRPVDIEVAQANVKQAIAAAKQAEAHLEEASIRVPIAGRVLEIYARPGETIGNKGIAELGQTNQMDVVAEIYQTDIAQIREGQSATITSESLSRAVYGTVRQIGLQVAQQEVTSGEPGENLDRRIVNVWIQINPEDIQIVENLTNLQVQVAIQI